MYIFRKIKNNDLLVHLGKKSKEDVCEDLQLIHRNAVICQKHEIELKENMTCRGRYQNLQLQDLEQPSCRKSPVSKTWKTQSDKTWKTVGSGQTQKQKQYLEDLDVFTGRR